MRVSFLQELAGRSCWLLGWLLAGGGLLPAGAQTITGFTPGSGAAGSQITLTGTGLTGTTGVSFNGQPTTGLQVTSSTSLTAYVPVGASTGTIRVTKPTGTAVSAATFTVTPPPPDVAVTVTPAGPVSACAKPTLTASAAIRPFASSIQTNGTVQAVAQLPDGRLLIGGHFSTAGSVVRSNIARLKPSGAVDASFAPTGTGIDYDVYAVALQPDGKVLIGGQFTKYNGAPCYKLARLNADGTLDATFTSGLAVSAAVETIALQPDGKVVIGGNFYAVGGVTRNFLARLNADGSLDTSFMAVDAGLDATVRAVAVQPDGKVLVAGDFDTRVGAASNAILRLNADGTRDYLFSAYGFASTDQLTALLLQPDGKIVVAGNFISY